MELFKMLFTNVNLLTFIELYKKEKREISLYDNL